MKTLFTLLALAVACLFFINADTTPVETEPLETKPLAVTPASSIVQANSNHYRIYYEGTDADAKNFAVRMESCLELYNSVLHFDLAKLKVKLKVRIFADKSGFDAYLKTIIKDTRDDFVYIHYSDLGKCEMVGFQKTVEADFYTALLHQGAVQFLKAHVANPPLWLQEGLAAYFEQAVFSASKSKYILPTDLVWLTTLKKMAKGESEQRLIGFDSFLTLDKTQAQVQLASFYPQAWGLVYFLLNSKDSNVNRILWDSIAALDPTLTASDNAVRVKEKAFGWYGVAKMETDFRNYINGLKTLSDLVAEGVTYYTNNDLDKSRDSFTKARDRGSENYIAWYYLGLISYNKKDYSNAETLYLKAMDLKAPEALINFAIGVNAYADNNYEKAATFLKNAKALDAIKYGEKADSILKEIGGETIVPPPEKPKPIETPLPPIDEEEEG